MTSPSTSSSHTPSSSRPPSPSPLPNRPKRQNSTLSSTSSGNRTIRANSQKGRRRSSTSQQPTTPTNSNGSLFARLTGRKKRNEQDEEEDEVSELEVTPTNGPRNVEAGPSDYWRRSPSPDAPLISPPIQWRSSGAEAWPDDLEDGPSDRWYADKGSRSPPYDQRNGNANGAEYEGEVGTPDIRDEMEFERRLEKIRLEGLRREEPRHVSGHQGGHGDVSRVTTGEEEFGNLNPSLQDDQSSQAGTAPSTPSISIRNGIFGNNSMDTPSPTKRPSYIHPSISRLRSHMRTASSSTQQSLPRPSHLHFRTASHFSLISQATSDTSLPGPSKPSLLPEINSSGPAFTFHPLRNVSAHLFGRKNGTASTSQPTATRKASSVLGIANGGGDDNNGYGRPSVLDVRGMIAVGTDKGWVLVYGFGQDLRYTLGNEQIASTSGPVTCVTISSDQTYIAVGHSTGNIHLYELLSSATPTQSTKPARTTLALPLKQVLSGRKEGHLQGSRILHIGFVGKRHTSIVSGDEDGRAFWWSLGKVVGVESNDVVRMLGSYPEPGTAPSPGRSNYPSKKATTLFAALPLPLGARSHGTDAFDVSVLVTPVKLVVVGMKPSARTWFRKMRDLTGGEMGGVVGCAAWLRAGEVDDDKGEVSDPVLAYSWGTSVRFLRVKIVGVEIEGSSKGVVEEQPEFVEGRKYDASSPVRALQWYDQNHVLLITSDEIILLDVRSMKPVEQMSLQTNLLTSSDSYAGLAKRGVEVPDCFASSVKTYKDKLFLLTRSNVQVGNLQHWNDRILTHVHRGDFLSAIRTALAYYQLQPPGNTINLPTDPNLLRETVGKRIKELMKASLDWAFSEERMKDDTHYSVDGRGVDLTELFEGLATCCIEACLSMTDPDFLFQVVYEQYANAYIQSLFFKVLEPYILEVKPDFAIPPNVIQAIIGLHDEKGEYEEIENIIWGTDPRVLDINQVVGICERGELWDVLCHVYTRALGDYEGPIVKFLGIIADVQRIREGGISVEEEYEGRKASDGYRLFGYLENILSGMSHPTGEKLGFDESNQAKEDVYGMIFSGNLVKWPKPDGEIVKTDRDGEIAQYPYLDLILRFDTEAFLHAMDIAFEDSFLNDSTSISRQTIINLLLDTISPHHDPSSFAQQSQTLLNIFVSRNLPKYPQFLFIPPTTLHRVLLSLASDEDGSTREDRQLAAEYLLSAYNPGWNEELVGVFERGGFWRILRGLMGSEGKLSEVVRFWAMDGDVGVEGVFQGIRGVGAGGSEGVEAKKKGVEGVLERLLELSVGETARLVDDEVPGLHERAVEVLKGNEHRLMFYLRCLLQPDEEEDGVSSRRMSTKLDKPLRHLYVDLLSRLDRDAAIPFLESTPDGFLDLQVLEKQSREDGWVEGRLWALNAGGHTGKAMKVVGDVVRERGVGLASGLVGGEAGDVHLEMEGIVSVVRMGVGFCKAHTGEVGSEEMWFGVLNDILDLTHSVEVLRVGGSRGSHSIIEEEVKDSLRGLVQDTLQSLINSSSSSTTPNLSFPRLFKRLVEASSGGKKGGGAGGRAYSEFRGVLGGMLESYRAESEILEVTVRLVRSDLYDEVEGLVKGRKSGWRGGAMTGCEVCGEFGVEGKGGVAVYGDGRVLHRACEGVVAE